MDQDPTLLPAKATEWTIREGILIGLRAIAVNFPVGAGLVQAWSDWEGHRTKQRIEEFFRVFRALLERDGGRIAAIEERLRGTPEFADLLESTVRRVITETDGRKREITAIAFFNATAAGATLPAEEKERLLESLNTLTIPDIDRLRIFGPGGPVSLSVFLESRVNPMASPDQQAEPAGALALEIAKLEARALIAETAPGASSWNGDSNHWVNRLRRKTYVLLPAGRRLLQLVSNP